MRNYAYNDGQMHSGGRVKGEAIRVDQKIQREPAASRASPNYIPLSQTITTMRGF